MVKIDVKTYASKIGVKWRKNTGLNNIGVNKNWRKNVLPCLGRLSYINWVVIINQQIEIGQRVRIHSRLVNEKHRRFKA